MPNVKNHTLSSLLDQEKQSYTALSALIDFITGHSKPLHEYKPPMDFELYKDAVLDQLTQLKIKNKTKSKKLFPENQFNVMHYQRAILTASKANYRNMAILAAIHSLSPCALNQLVKLVKKSCVKISREIKLEERKLAVPKYMRKSPSVIISTSTG